MTAEKLIDFIFFPRKSNSPKDKLEHLISVDTNTKVGCRFFLKDKDFHNILFFLRLDYFLK